MFLTGLAFAVAADFGWLLLVAFVGTINPSAGNVSIFVPMENALLAGSAPANRRTRVFAAYGLTGAIAASVGSLAAGSPDLLVQSGFARIDALRAMFILYAVLGVAGALCYRLIPAETASAPASHSFALGPSRRIVLRLAALFSIDAFAGGFAVQSLLALWLFERFDMSLAAAGGFFFASGLLAALSYPAAAWLAGRIGLLNTMVYTHITVEPVSHRRRARPGSRDRARSPACAGGALANGRAHPLVLRHGGRHARRACGGRQRHLGAARARGGGEPGPCRRLAGGGILGMAAGDLRRAQDRV